MLILNSQNQPKTNLLAKVENYNKSLKGNEFKQNSLDQFIISLEQNYLTSEDSVKYFTKTKLFKLLQFFLGGFCLIIGFAIIMIPLPNNLEIATLIFFNPNDGFTVSDLIALIAISFGGILIVRNIKSIVFKY